MELIYKVNNKRYVLFNIPVANMRSHSSIMKQIKSSKSILRGTESIKYGSFFKKTVITLSVLVPESEALNFSKFLVTI